MKTYAEYQAGVGDKRRGPAGRRATDRSFSLAQGKRRIIKNGVLVKKNSATRVPGAVWTMSYGFKRPINTLISIVLLRVICDTP